MGWVHWPPIRHPLPVGDGVHCTSLPLVTHKTKPHIPWQPCWRRTEKRWRMTFKDAKANVLTRFLKHVFLGSWSTGHFANGTSFSHDAVSEICKYKQRGTPVQIFVEMQAGHCCQRKRTNSESEKQIIFWGIKVSSSNKGECYFFVGGKKAIMEHTLQSPFNVNIRQKCVCSALPSAVCCCSSRTHQLQCPQETDSLSGFTHLSSKD